MGHAANGEVHRPRHAVSGSVGTISENVAGRTVLADTDLPPRVPGGRAAEVTRRSPDNRRTVTADAAAGIAANIVGQRFRGPGLLHLPWPRGAGTDGAEIFTMGISESVHGAVGENEPLCPVPRWGGQSCRPGQRRIAHARERRCVHKVFPTPANCEALLEGGCKGDRQRWPAGG